jgi:3-polyprenyl-4-hydroxybenzoate decarboxylase
MSHDTKIRVRVALKENIRLFLKYRKDPYFRTEIKELIKAYREVCKI